MSPKSLSPEIVDLCFRLSEGTLTEGQALVLRRWLAESHANRLAYVELFSLLAGLEWECGGVTRDSFSMIVDAPPAADAAPAGIAIPGLNKEEPPCLPPAGQIADRPRTAVLRGLQPRSFPGPSNWVRFLCVVAVYYGLITLVFWGIGSPRIAPQQPLARTPASAHPPQNAHPPAASSETDPSAAPLRTDETLAQLVEARDCVWHQSPPNWLHAGERLKLARGHARIHFSDGAIVDLEGPSELEIRTAATGYLHKGKLLAEVPRRAVGFTIDTPSLQVVDLGTEFGVQVDTEGKAEVHVFRGMVKTRSTHPAPGAAVAGGYTLLRAGEAVRTVPDSPGLIPLTARRDRFLVDQAPAESVELLGFYPFEGNVRDAAGEQHATTVSEIEFVAGKAGQAAWFSGKESSFIELPLDASVQAAPDMTWGAWVKPAAEVTRRSEILSTDNDFFDRVLTIDNRRGTFEEEQYRFAAMAGPKVGVLPSRGPLPSPERWTFVAAVYRSETETAMLYVEDPTLAGGKGGLVSDLAAHAVIGPSRQTIRVGGHPKFPESFHGSIDNVFVFRGALGHRELDQIRREGAAAIRRLGGLDSLKP